MPQRCSGSVRASFPRWPTFVVVTAEENYLNGGSGMAVSEYARMDHPGCRVINIAVPDRYISHAARSEQWAECGLTPEAVIDAIKIQR